MMFPGDHCQTVSSLQLALGWDLGHTDSREKAVGEGSSWEAAEAASVGRMGL